MYTFAQAVDELIEMADECDRRQEHDLANEIDQLLIQTAMSKTADKSLLEKLKALLGLHQNEPEEEKPDLFDDWDAKHRNLGKGKYPVKDFTRASQVRDDRPYDVGQEADLEARIPEGVDDDPGGLEMPQSVEQALEHMSPEDLLEMLLQGTKAGDEDLTNRPSGTIQPLRVDEPQQAPEDEILTAPNHDHPPTIEDLRRMGEHYRSASVDQEELEFARNLISQRKLDQAPTEKQFKTVPKTTGVQTGIGKLPSGYMTPASKISSNISPEKRDWILRNSR